MTRATKNIRSDRALSEQENTISEERVMPEYEFYCKTCGERFTAFMHVKEHDVGVAECPECHDKRRV